MPIEVELSVSLQNPSSQSDYNHSLRKVVQSANRIAQEKLELARMQQSNSYNSKVTKIGSPLNWGKLVGCGAPRSLSLGGRGLAHIKCALEGG